MKYDRNMCEREKVIHLSVFFVRRFAFELQKNSLHRNRNCCYSISGFDCWMCFRFISFSSVCLSPPCSKNNCDARDKQLPFFFIFSHLRRLLIQSLNERTKGNSDRLEANQIPKHFNSFHFNCIDSMTQSTTEERNDDVIRFKCLSMFS